MRCSLLTQTSASLSIEAFFLCILLIGKCLPRSHWFNVIDVHLGSEKSKIGAVVRALAFTQCSLGSVPWPVVMCGLSFCSERFDPRFSASHLSPETDIWFDWLRFCLICNLLNYQSHSARLKFIETQMKWALLHNTSLFTYTPWMPVS